MSCQNNSNKNVAAAVKGGISSLGSKAAYVAGTAGGATAGAAVGSLFVPMVGTAVGGVVGGWAGAKLVARAQRKRIERREEAAWQGSSPGIKAVSQRDRRLAKARESYQKQDANLRAQKAGIEDKYQRVRKKGIEAVSGARGQGLKGLATSPEAKAAGGAVLSGVAKVAGLAVIEEMGGYSQSRPPAQRTQRAAARLGREAIRGAGGMKGRVEEAREKAWLSTPEGKTTQEKYESDMKAWQRKKSEFGRQYALAREKVEGQYELARDEFMRKRKAGPAATVTADAAAGGH